MPWKFKDTIPPHPASVTDIIDGGLDEMTRLALMGRKIRALPDDIDHLGNLTHLYVDHNAMTELPPSLAGIVGSGAFP